MSEDKLKEASVAYHSSFEPLIDDIFRERVKRARAASLESKMLAGQRLFESACEITLMGIRNQFPGESDARHREILRERLAMRRKWENQ